MESLAMKEAVEGVEASDGRFVGGIWSSARLISSQGFPLCATPYADDSGF